MKTEDLEHIEETRRAFDEHADRYEKWFSDEEGELIKKTEKKAAEKLVPEGKGVEVGVGSGIFASELGVDYGIDPAEELLDMARSRGVKTVLGIAESLPFKKEKFDFLLFMFTLSFLTDPSKAFEEAHRVLSPEGKLIVCFIPRKSPWGKLYREKKSENHDFYKQAHFYEIPKPIELLEKSGFKKTKAVSTLFQKPGSVKNVEESREGIHETAGLCCIKAQKISR